MEENKNNLDTEQTAAQVKEQTIKTAGMIAAKAKDGKLVKNLVVVLTEALLPVVFWIGLIAILFMSYQTGNAWGSFSFKTFAITLGIYTGGWIGSFYLLYLFIDIRDKLHYANTMAEAKMTTPEQP